MGIQDGRGIEWEDDFGVAAVFGRLDAEDQGALFDGFVDAGISVPGEGRRVRGDHRKGGVAALPRTRPAICADAWREAAGEPAVTVGRGRRGEKRFERAAKS